ncbi:MAG: asparagine synthase (glutamine-hydrolyzing) [Solirubrobacterales bacterium]|nr:asparagine synthase (glutamine-hydrolyzing) [Solirubrobacterales bacterium]
MCGIAGVFEYRRRAAVDEAALVRMRETLRHRGPDGEGLFISPDRMVGLGHRRLAIVDPAGGAQPMVGPTGQVLVFNGEIYNYPTLRRELEADGICFRTRCDSEVILRLYERDGEGCVDRLNGMFAFAIWDPDPRKLFFARDGIGEKPFYWTDLGGTFLFGSEIKAILADQRVRREVNEEAIAPYLVNLVTPSPETLFRGIWKLAPGHCGSCSPDGVSVRRYWDPFQPRRARPDSLQTSVAGVRRLLTESVHARLMADVPVGVLLSGGVDSTGIVAMLGARAKGVATFSVGFEGSSEIDERAIARTVADHYGTDHHEVVVTESAAMRSLTKLVHHQDEPLADPVCVPLMFVCELARATGVPVVMAGEGADELFWGYPRYRQIMAREQWLRALLALPSPLRRAAPSLVPASWHPRLRDLLEGIARGRPYPMHMPLGLTSRQVDQLIRVRLRRSDGWTHNSTPNGDPIATLGWDTQEYEFGLRLPELLLMRIDRFSMAHGVEARVPFLDPGLVDYAYRIPFEQKLLGDESKRVLKLALAGLVPRWVLERPKQGFGAPVDRWFQSGFEDLLRRLMDSEAMGTYFDIGRMEGGYRDRRLGRNRLRFSLWFILNFALWHRQWIEGESTEELIERSITASARR